MAQKESKTDRFMRKTIGILIMVFGTYLMLGPWKGSYLAFYVWGSSVCIGLGLTDDNFLKNDDDSNGDSDE